MRTRPLFALAFFAILVAASKLPGSSQTPGKAEEPAEVRVTNLDRLNSPADEDDPCVAPDGQRLFFTCNAAGNFDIMMAEKRPPRQNFFANPKPVEELNSKNDEGSPFPLPREADGSEYIFLSLYDAKNYDIFFTRKLSANEPYMRSALAGVLGVCTPQDETHPWLVQIGKSFELYFSRKTSAG